jgi:hypothetical protein
MARERGMADILQFVRSNTSFDPETLAILGAAFDRATVNLHDTGQPAVVCEIMAGRIIAAAMTGERDPDRLCQIATRGIRAAG